MNAPEQSRRPGFTEYLAAGRMPLWLAAIFGLFGSMGATIALAGLSPGGNFDIILYVLVVVMPGLGVPFLARYKRRAMLRWAAAALVALLLGTGLQITFLPLMVLITLTFAVKPPIKIPESTLEAEEDPSGMRGLLGIREEAGVLHARVEEVYLQRGYTAIVGLRDDLDALDARLGDVPPQSSDRGGRVRMHLHAGIVQLLQVTDSADYVGSTVAEMPSLARIANGDDTGVKGKAEKALHKQVREIEIQLDHSRIQLGVARGVLTDLGFPPPKPVARPWMPPQAVLPPMPPPPPGPSGEKPRSQRSQRRSRF
jgi:hypothetical protein